MADMTEVYDALRKANAAGDTASVKKLVDYIGTQGAATGAAQIPTEPGANLMTTTEAPSTLLGKIRGAIETVPALATGAVAGVVGPAAGLAQGLFGGKYGTPEGVREASQTAANVSNALSYQPRTAEGQQYTGAIGNALAGMVGVPIPTLTDLGRAAAPAARAVGDLNRAVAKAPVPMGMTLEQQAAERTAQSYANAPIIDAAAAAKRTGLAVNPAVTNPTSGNKAKAAAIGTAFEDTAAKYNAQQVTDLVRQDLGAASTEKLTPAIVERALDAAGKPYDVVRKMATLQTPPAMIDQLNALKTPALIGGESSAAAVSSLVDDAISKLEAGRSGALVLDDIRSMRRNAQAVYKAQAVNPDPLAMARADTQMTIANLLENVIDANAPSPKVLADMQAARVRMAQIYDHDRAINYANKTVDPQVYAKLMEERQGKMTGVGADIGTVAATFPDIVKTHIPSALEIPRAARSGLLAAAGAVAGGAVAGYPGAIAGASIGGAAGWTGTRLAAKKMVTPAYQSAHAVPKDYRNALAPQNVNQLGQ